MFKGRKITVKNIHTVLVKGVSEKFYGGVGCQNICHDKILPPPKNFDTHITPKILPPTSKIFGSPLPIVCHYTPNYFAMPSPKFLSSQLSKIVLPPDPKICFVTIPKICCHITPQIIFDT